MHMNELLQLIIGNPDLPVLAALAIFLLTRVNAIDRKVATICTRLNIMENHISTITRDLKYGTNKRSKDKISQNKKR